MKRTLLYLLLLPALLSGTCLLAAGPAGNAGHGAKPCLRRLTCEGLTLSLIHISEPTRH